MAKTSSTPSRWNKSTAHTAPQHVRVYTENTETNHRTFIYSYHQAPLRQLLAAAPALRYYVDGDSHDIILPGADCGIDDDTVIAILDAIVAQGNEKGLIYQFKVPYSPIAYIRTHAVLVLFGLEKEAKRLEEGLWDLFSKHELSFDEVSWIWEVWGSQVERSRHVPPLLDTYIPPFSETYVQVMAWQILNLELIKKLNKDIKAYVCGTGEISDRRLKALIDRRYDKYEFGKGFEQTCAMKNPVNKLVPADNKLTASNNQTTAVAGSKAPPKLNLTNANAGISQNRDQWENAAVQRQLTKLRPSSSEEDSDDDQNCVPLPAPHRWLLNGPTSGGISNAVTQAFPEPTCRGGRSTSTTSPFPTNEGGVRFGTLTAAAELKSRSVGSNDNQPNPLNQPNSPPRSTSTGTVLNPQSHTDQGSAYTNDVMDTSSPNSGNTPAAIHQHDGSGWGFQGPENTGSPLSSGTGFGFPPRPMFAQGEGAPRTASGFDNPPPMTTLNTPTIFNSTQGNVGARPFSSPARTNTGTNAGTTSMFDNPTTPTPAANTGGISQHNPFQFQGGSGSQVNTTRGPRPPSGTRQIAHPRRRLYGRPGKP